VCPTPDPSTTGNQLVVNPSNLSAPWTGTIDALLSSDCEVGASSWPGHNPPFKGGQCVSVQHLDMVQ